MNDLNVHVMPEEENPARRSHRSRILVSLTCGAGCAGVNINSAVTVTATQIAVVITGAATSFNVAHTLTFPAGVLTTGTPQAATSGSITVRGLEAYADTAGFSEKYDSAALRDALAFKRIEPILSLVTSLARLCRSIELIYVSNIHPITIAS